MAGICEGCGNRHGEMEEEQDNRLQAIHGRNVCKGILGISLFVSD
jgi:hypothetical protein